MPLPFRHRTTKKESRRRRRRAVAALEERTEGTTDRTEALEWLTTGLELALRTGDPDSARGQLRPLRASCLSALGRQSGEIQERAAQREHM